MVAIQRRNIDRKAPFEWGNPKTHEYIPHMKGPYEQAEVVSATTKQLTKEIATATGDRGEKPKAGQPESTLMEYRMDITQCT